MHNLVLGIGIGFITGVMTHWSIRKIKKYRHDKKIWDDFVKRIRVQLKAGTLKI
ncbi:hypothetical protein SH1V18_15220 [Vallitalea longa]|uniref:Uncharacterized protein n=1 Tax=Vallitalea longa TaxID=2936439 RepID=A0A9W6DF24_9FIRM|nr:hypothetical protein [Vallitalea longa]GKX29042.1 hypothetical protein SH1V18_15220 [Vallitalea longa]